MRAVSKQRQRENRQRRAVLDGLYEAEPWCAACGVGMLRDALDGHERLSRARGGSITDAANVVLVCRPCHDRITTEPAWAEAHGWALASGAA